MAQVLVAQAEAWLLKLATDITLIQYLRKVSADFLGENMKKFLILATALIFTSTLGAAPKELNIYMIDVEGGGGTLIVSPSGESLLIDSGSGSHDRARDTKRIADLARNVAHIQKIDYVLITHYHGDHIGGVYALSKLIPIGRYLDHGELTPELQKPEMVAWWRDYKALTGDDRTVLKAGDKIPLKGVNATVVIAAGQAITTPLKGSGPNPVYCKDGVQKPTDQDPENGMSIGTVLTYGHFRFSDLGDLPWIQEQLLACPTNMIGHMGRLSDQSPRL